MAFAKETQCSLGHATYELKNHSFQIRFIESTKKGSTYADLVMIFPGTAKKLLFNVDAGNGPEISAISTLNSGSRKRDVWFFYMFDKNFYAIYGGLGINDPAPSFIFLPNILSMSSSIRDPGRGPTNGILTLGTCD